MRNYMIEENEDVGPANKHPVATGISMFVLFIGTIAFACLALAAGCSSPSDDSGGDDVVSDVDGSTTDQTDGNGGNCATNGTCPDAGANTDAPSTATCATNAWMENPEMFDCNQFDQNGNEVPFNFCDPILIDDPGGCQIKCVGDFWATPEQLTINVANHSFDVQSDPEAIYPTYRCRQRQW